MQNSVILVVRKTKQKPKQKKMNTETQQRLELLDGCEVRSIKHEGVVGINGKKMKGYVNGREFDLTIKDINYLYRRMMQEYGF